MNNKFTDKQLKRDLELYSSSKSIQSNYEDTKIFEEVTGTSSTYLNNLIFDPKFVEEYSKPIRQYMVINDVGAVKTDIDELSEFYTIAKTSQCEDYKARFDVEGTFMYNFGAAISKAAYSETRSYTEEPDTESIIEDLLARGDEWYFMNKNSLAMKKGAYDREMYLKKLSEFEENIY